MKKILAITDLDSNGSGYKNICAPLFTELVKMGHEIKVAGLMYDGREQDYPFHLIPAMNFQDAQAICQNLIYLWKPDAILVALDLPLQAQYFSIFSPYLKRFPDEDVQTPRKYVAITPLENGPLTMSWAAPLFNMDAVFFISELGKQEAQKVGVFKAEHLMIGVDTESYRPPTPEERTRLRDGLGVPQDAFVVLTVAENQERKNLWAGMASICLLTHGTMTEQDFLQVIQGKKRANEFPKTRTNVRYVLVTRENSNFGWKLRDLSVTLDISQEYICFERGLPTKDLWGLYAVADVYLQPSKAEGLGLPVLEAMACKVPVVATDTGAMTELLAEKRGLLVPPSYTFVDVWGNSKRDMISVWDCKDYLEDIIKWQDEGNWWDTDRALAYVKARTWDIPAKQLHDKIEAE